MINSMISASESMKFILTSQLSLPKYKLIFTMDFLMVQGNITESQVQNDNAHASTIDKSIKHMNSVQRNINYHIQTLSDRINGIEGQASRLSAKINFKTPL